jgi:hypothetical protein
MLYDPFHLAVNRLTYWQHFIVAGKLCFHAGVILLFGLVHLICPYLFTEVVSDRVDRMADIIKH